MSLLLNVKVKFGIMLITIIPLYAIEIAWEPEIPISTVDGVESYLSGSQQRSIAVGPDGRIHAVWHEPQTPYPDVYWGVWYRSSNDNGATWSMPECISPAIYAGGYVFNYTNMDPSIAVLGRDGVHVVWDGIDENYFDGYAIYRRSLDHGQTWEYHGIWQYWAVEPPSGFNSLCSDGDNYLLFYDQQWVPQFMEYRLLNLYSSNNGDNWQSGSWHGWLNGEKPDNSPCTACDSNDMGYVAWEAVDTLNHSVIMFGTTSGVEKALVPYPGTGGRDDPFIESDLAGRLYVVWSDSRDGNPEIYFKKSTDGGSTWSNDAKLTNTSASSKEPTIVLGSSGKIFLAWIEGGVLGNVFFKYSEDDGLSWSSNTQLTNNPASRMSPHIAISPDNLNLYVIWNDNRDGQWEVYFKRGTTQIGVEEQLTKDSKTQCELSICPNPFKEITRIEIQIPNTNRLNSMADQTNANTQMTIRIYDTAGRAIINFPKSPYYQLQDNYVIWDGTNDAGVKVAAGVYFVRLETPNNQKTAKIILTR